MQQNGRDHDYARKQWSGLLADVYIPRAELYKKQALQDAAAGRPFDNVAASDNYTALAFAWQTAFPSHYPTKPIEDPVTVSNAAREKYAKYFSACASRYKRSE